MTVRTIEEIRESLAKIINDDTAMRHLARAVAYNQEARRLLGLPPLEVDERLPPLPDVRR